jgi:lysozyme family protein
MTFEESFKVLIGHEGGYSDDRNDPGNWTGGKVGAGEMLGTKYGVAANSYPMEDIKNLTLERAQQIYRRDYWDKLHADDLPKQVRFAVFDGAVNSGVGQAAKWLQRAVGVKDDGIIGQGTLAAVRAIDQYKLAAVFNGQRLKFMTELKVFDKYGKGWARRIAENLINLP